MSDDFTSWPKWINHHVERWMYSAFCSLAPSSWISSVRPTTVSQHVATEKEETQTTVSQRNGIYGGPLRVVRFCTNVLGKHLKSHFRDCHKHFLSSITRSLTNVINSIQLFYVQVNITSNASNDDTIMGFQRLRSLLTHFVESCPQKYQ